jgi:hypothetical protein
MKVNNEPSASNGNINVSRNVVNNNISKYSMLGKTKKTLWDAKRSFRSI